MCCSKKNVPFSSSVGATGVKQNLPSFFCPAGLLRAFTMLMGFVTLREGMCFPKLRCCQVLKNLYLEEELISLDALFSRHADRMPREADCHAQGPRGC